MAFENLSDRLQMALRRVTGRGKLNENDIDTMMREVRLSLLEADVNYKVVKNFTKEVKEKALGERVMKSLTPGQQVVKIVHEELKELMGSVAESLQFKINDVTILMMVGLNGAGKTTQAGKLANFLRKKDKKNPLLVAADVYRPAAIDQLVTIGKQLSIPVFEKGTDIDPVTICKESINYAKENNHDVIILDTAGRFHVNEELMEELVNINAAVKPDEILLVVDAMTGQDAVNVANSFNEKLQLSGAILTKLDGDTRGGAALSIRKVTNVPIKFIGLGEKLDQIEVFHPERMASRILGMGDMLSLIEKAQENIDEEESMKLAEKMMSGELDFNDYIKQVKMIRRLGNFKGILKMIPGLGSQLKNIDIDEKIFDKHLSIINSMTKQERKNPKILNSSRRMRIANGCGQTVTEVNKLVKSVNDMKQQMKSLSKMNPNNLEKMMSGKGPMPNMGGSKAKKGKGKNKGRFKF